MNKFARPPLKGITTTHVKERVIKPLMLGLCISGLMLTFVSRFTFLPPISDYPCIPGRLFIMDRADQIIDQGDLVTFKARGVELFADDTLFTKIAIGLEGDKVEVLRGAVKSGDLSFSSDIGITADYLGITLDSLVRTEKIDSGKLFALGTLPGSYDSRFWGQVDIKEQVVGKTYVIF